MQIEYIILHHSAILQKDIANQFDAIKKGHVAKGWGDIGYHFLIESDGTLKEGRKQDKVGAHCYGRNNDSLGICLAGNFSIEQPTSAQEKSLSILLEILTKEYPTATIMHHRNFKATQCPGNNIPKDWYKQLKTALMKLYIDSDNQQILGDAKLKFGYSIPNEEKLEEITNHCKKLGIELDAPEKNDLLGWYIVRGTDALGWKSFLNI